MRKMNSIEIIDSECVLVFCFILNICLHEMYTYTLSITSIHAPLISVFQISDCVRMNHARIPLDLLYLLLQVLKYTYYKYYYKYLSTHMSVSYCMFPTNMLLKDKI